MTKKKSEIEIGRDIAIERQLKLEYEEWLKDVGKERSPHNAHEFAMEKLKINGGYDYMGKNDREIILLLENELPTQ